MIFDVSLLFFEYVPLKLLFSESVYYKLCTCLDVTSKSKAKKIRGERERTKTKLCSRREVFSTFFISGV